MPRRRLVARPCAATGRGTRRPAGAPEALAALQDTAEGFAGLRHHSALRLPDSASWTEMATARDAVACAAEWLDVIGATEPAEAYRALAERMTGTVTHNVVGEIGDLLATIDTAVQSVRPLVAPYLEAPLRTDSQMRGQ